MLGKASASITVLALVLPAACASDPVPPSTSDVLQLDACRPRSTDSFDLGDLSVDGDELRIHVATGGGCASHTFSACWDRTATKSDPPQTNVALFHDGHGDTCDALLTHDLRVDVSPIRAMYRPPVVLHVTGATAQIAGTTNSATLR
jgi:hypothetical protein